MTQAPSFEATIQEALVKPFMNFAEQLRRALSGPSDEDLVATLQQNYRDERRLATQLRAHAAVMPNDLFRDTLDEIAADTEHHAQLLAEQVQILGGALPADNGQEAAEVELASTIWRLIAGDIAAIGAISHRYQTQLGEISSPQVRRLLDELRTAKHRHRQRLSDLLARIDSYAMPESDHSEHP